MSEKSVVLKELSACVATIRHFSRQHRYHVERKIETKEEALRCFRHEAYVILLVLEQIADDKTVDAFRAEYNRLKDRITEIIVNGDEQ